MRMQKPGKQRTAVADVTAYALKAIVPQRFIAARQLSGLNAIEAAERMGFKNSSMLSKIENGKAAALPYVIARASLVYAVSSDFLIGLSDFPEKDPATVEQQATMRMVRQTVTDQAAVTMRAISQIAGDYVPLRAHVEQLVKHVGVVYQQFCRNSSAAEPMRGSLDELVEQAENASGYLKRKALINGRAYMAGMLDEVEYPLLAVIERQGLVEQQAASLKAGASVCEE